MAKKGDVCERCGEAISKARRRWCPSCKIWLCRFCVKFSGACPVCKTKTTK